MIKANFDNAGINKHIEKWRKRAHKIVIRNLSYLGEKCVAEAKRSGNYMDRTSNLRNSIGYFIFANGVLVSRNISGTKRGVKSAEKAVKRLSRDKDGYALVVVAGMNYASYVEARGYNVLSSVELLAEREMPKIIKNLNIG